MKRLLILIVLMVGAAGVAILLMRTVARTEVTDVFTAPGPIRQVTLDIDTGGITVDSGADQALTARITRVYAFWGPNVQSTARAGAVRLVGDCPLVGVITACRADFAVVAPATAKVDARSTAGGIMVTGISGPVTATSTAGGVAVLRSRAPQVRASSTAGNVRVEAMIAPNRVEATTSAGDVDVVVPRGSYRVDASAGAGSVNITGITRDDSSPRTITASATAGNVTVTGR